MRLPPRHNRTGRFLRSAHGAIAARQSNAGMVALLVPAALIAVGVLMWKRQGAGMSGINAPYGAFPLAGLNAPYGAFPLAGFGSKLKKSVSKATSIVSKISPSVAITRKLANVAKNKMPGLIKQMDPVKNLQKSPLFGRSLLLNRLRPRSGGKTTAGPGEQIVYQDINGATVTKAEYDALTQAIDTRSAVFILSGNRWAMPTGTIISNEEYLALQGGSRQSPGIMPPPHGDNQGTSYTNIVQPEPSYNQPSSGGGGGGGGQSYDLGPEAPQLAPQQQQYADSPADMPAPAASKLNPLIAIGTLIAVPVVLGLTKGH